jgi:hypothetical protein
LLSSCNVPIPKEVKDANGNVIEENKVDKSGKFIVEENEIATTKFKYDSVGRFIEARFYLANGKLGFDSVNGGAIVKQAYNEKGRVIAQKNYGTA